MLKLIGMNIEHYVGEEQVLSSEEILGWVPQPKELSKHLLYFKDTMSRKYHQFVFSLEYTYCGSGYCGAIIAHLHKSIVKSMPSLLFKPKTEILISEDFLVEDYEAEKELKNEVFKFSHVGSDAYYPSGYYEINMELFCKNKRAKEKRLVWILKGVSGAGKSFLAHKTDRTVFETDDHYELPETIVEDVVVLGNKYPHSLEDVYKRLFGDPEVYVVDFTEYHSNMKKMSFGRKECSKNETNPN